MLLTTEIVKKYEGGQLEIQNTNKDYIYRGEIEHAWVEDGELHVRFKWIAKMGKDDKWHVHKELDYSVSLEIISASEISENRISYTVMYVGEKGTFFPIGGTKLDADRVIGLRYNQNEISALCRKVLSDTLGAKEEEIEAVPWNRFIFDFASENKGRKDPGKIEQDFKAKLDQFLAQLKGVKGFWKNALQRHHDYYVFLMQEGGGLTEADMAQYELAMGRERNGEVKPLPANATSPFG